MANKWVHPEDCEVIRPDSNYDVRVDGAAVLMDNDGNRIFVVPESFTDAQIWECLRIANIAFADGEDQGASEKARQIRKELLITEV